MSLNTFCVRMLPRLVSAALVVVPLVAESAMFQLRDQNPLERVYGAPHLGFPGLPDAGQWLSQLTFTRSNTLNSQFLADEALFIDGETDVTTLSFVRGLQSEWSVGVHIPLVSHGSGASDSFVADYHDALGFPDGDRQDYPQGQFTYLYQQQGENLIWLNQSTSGLGDIALMASYQWKDSEKRRVALHSQLKLPTGDHKELLGSGGADYSNWVESDYRANEHWILSGHFGLTVLGSSEVAPGTQSDIVWFAGAGAEWLATQRFSLQTQIDYHTAFYKNTRIDFLKASAQLTTGMRLRLGQQYRFDLALTEEVDRGMSPDLGIHLALGKAF